MEERGEEEVHKEKELFILKLWQQDIATLKQILAFCDENQKITRHPMMPTWPEAMLTTISLEAESADKTRVTVKWEVAGKATEAERETFAKAKGGMSQGWDGSFEKLEKKIEKYLRTQPIRNQIKTSTKTKLEDEKIFK